MFEEDWASGAFCAVLGAVMRFCLIKLTAMGETRTSVAISKKIPVSAADNRPGGSGGSGFSKIFISSSASTKALLISGMLGISAGAEAAAG